MTSWITVCDTCKGDEWRDDMGQTDGEKLAALIRARTEGTGVRVRTVSCLMGCNRSCNVAIQAKGKLNYTLGDFIPAPKDASAIVEYACQHAQSESGQVPYRDWPEGVKGHFVTRHPPLPE